MDENDGFSSEDELSPDEEIEQAMQACGQTAVEGFCWHAGTEYCDFHCRFRGSLTDDTDDPPF